MVFSACPSFYTFFVETLEKSSHFFRQRKQQIKSIRLFINRLHYILLQYHHHHTEVHTFTSLNTTNFRSKSNGKTGRKVAQQTVTESHQITNNNDGHCSTIGYEWKSPSTNQ
jgi:hypothetical protein